MKKYFQLIVLFILIGFSSASQENLKSNSTITTVFNESEIEDLTRILNFFEEHICSTQHVEISKLADCYQSFFERMEEAVETGDIELKIPFEEQLNLYKQINESTFNEIWVLGKTMRFNSSDPLEYSDTLKYLSIKYDGKYVKFLEELAIENNVLNFYHFSFKANGGISPSMIASLLTNYDIYNINDLRVRLVVAIHYLTMNDQFERNEKY
jgi:hypothetical protein